FNSGRDGRLGILAANGALFPGSQSSASSLTMLLSPFPTLSSTGNTIMLQYLTGFFQSPVPACATQTFNDNLIQCLDRALGSTSAQGDSYFSPAERIKMGEALRLRM
ncbi:MAG TPA: hypothetical protein VEB40_05635, partial [Flavipsychrobacter sp.]|nr:hypothetical protein [Flavipsychrobacter sp.]